MADTGRTSERVVNGRKLKLAWYRCQICFSLSGELERPDETEPTHAEPQNSVLEVTR